MRQTSRYSSSVTGWTESRIEVTSEEGQGTAFHITLPVGA